MNKAWKYLAGSILNGAGPEEVGQDALDELIREYPYYAGLHYLKAVRLEGQEAGASARAKAALYFQNPHWFRALLDDTETIKVSEGSIAEVMSTPSSEWAPPVDTAPIHPHEETVNMVEQAEHEFDDKRSQEPNAELHWQDTLAENPVFHQQPSSDEEAFEHNVWHTQGDVREEPATAIAEIEPTGAATEMPEGTAAAQPEPETVTYETTEEAQVPEADTPVEEPMAGIETTPETTPAKEEEANPEEPVIPFEPLYTIDYFASQGIKYNLDAGKDNLSLKMKSFTEWLKSMKRIHPEKVEAELPDDAAIRENAESSNEAQDIYTEAMAEVYLKQGLKEKAREVFQKLSLLDPSKSAYFAVRIKEIKEN